MNNRSRATLARARIDKIGRECNRWEFLCRGKTRGSAPIRLVFYVQNNIVRNIIVRYFYLCIIPRPQILRIIFNDIDNIFLNIAILQTTKKARKISRYIVQFLLLHIFNIPLKIILN